MNLEGMKLFYIFQCPLGINDSKAGVTGHPIGRLGQYQNSYSARSHEAQFDIVYVGKPAQIDRLEKQIKIVYDWDIEHNGRGHTEWISHHTPEMIAEKVEELIKGFCFHIQRVPEELLPAKVNNMADVIAWSKKLK